MKKQEKIQPIQTAPLQKASLQTAPIQTAPIQTESGLMARPTAKPSVTSSLKPTLSKVKGGPNINDDAQQARDTLRQLIKDNGDDYKGLSELIGRNQSYIQQYIERGTPKFLAEKDRHILARYYGVNQQILGAPIAFATGLELIPKLSVRASAGAGNWDQMESIAGKIAFDPKWLRQFPYDSKCLSLVSVEGDSMLPTLSDGDDIMVARIENIRRKDGIYVLRFDDVLMVKRLSFGPNGKVDVISDNPSYSDWRDKEGSQLHIIGPVIWVARKL